MTSLKGRNTFNNLAAGCFFGALAVFGRRRGRYPWRLGGRDGPDGGHELDSDCLLLAQSVAVVFLAVALGAAAGLLVAIVDQLVNGRLRDGRMPFWVWFRR